MGVYARLREMDRRAAEHFRAKGPTTPISKRAAAGWWTVTIGLFALGERGRPLEFAGWMWLYVGFNRFASGDPIRAWWRRRG